jgi:hypothetical protein
LAAVPNHKTVSEAGLNLRFSLTGLSSLVVPQKPFVQQSGKEGFSGVTQENKCHWLQLGLAGDRIFTAELC